LKEKINIIRISILLLLVRWVDLFTTYISNVDFKNQEQNILVKVLNLNIFEFFVLEIFFSFVLVFIYVYSTNNTKYFKIATVNFLNYFELFFLKKKNASFFDWLFKVSFINVFVLFGSIIPIFIFSTSILFSLNNIWVYLYVSGNQSAIKYYLLFNNFYFFDFLIFVFPPIFLIYLVYKKLLREYKQYKYSA
jgi:hypothetical protein